MLEPHAHHAVSTRPVGGPCVRQPDSMEMGRCERGDPLFRSCRTGRNSHGGEHGHHGRQFHSLSLFRQRKPRPCRCGSTVSRFRDLEAGERRDHRQHGRTGLGECSCRARCSARSYTLSLSGWPACRGLSGQRDLLRTFECCSRDSLSRCGGDQQQWIESSGNSIRDLSRAAGIRRTAAGRPSAASAAQAATTRGQQDAKIAAELRCIELGANSANRSDHQSTGGHQACDQQADYARAPRQQVARQLPRSFPASRRLSIPSTSALPVALRAALEE